MAEDPFRAYNFALLIDGEEAGRFTEASGLGIKVDSIEYREGGVDSPLGRLPGQTRYNPLTLRYGVSRSRTLWDWFSATISGEVQRRDVALVLSDNDGTTEAFRWTLHDAWIADWRAAQLDASENEIAIESMTIVYESLERD